MERNYTKISVPIPGGFYVSSFDVVGRMLNVYLTNENPAEYKLVEVVKETPNT